jgi:hypothetical protein
MLKITSCALAINNLAVSQEQNISTCLYSTYTPCAMLTLAVSGAALLSLGIISTVTAIVEGEASDTSNLILLGAGITGMVVGAVSLASSSIFMLMIEKVKESYRNTPEDAGDII